MKTRWIQLIAGLAMFVLCISIFTTTTDATVIWEDDFDDGNYDGWTVCDNSTLHEGNYGWSGSTWSAANYYLQLEDDWGIISHPSDVAYGRWSFDFKANGTQMGNIAFISNNFYELNDTLGLYEYGQFYFINFDVDTYPEHTFTITLNKRFDDDKTILDYHAQVPAAGWHHFDVTRNTTGCFTVYHNGSQIMQVVDTDIDTSEMFWLWWSKWQTLDNVVVDDNWNFTINGAVDGDMTTILIIAGIGIAVVVMVLVVFVKRR
ncbi:MAG: hypothetical protein PVJ05_04680 [Candidatus Thorarchaeota archaeon]|jgi:hypothetical protein